MLRHYLSCEVLLPVLVPLRSYHHTIYTSECADVLVWEKVGSLLTLIVWHELNTLVEKKSFSFGFFDLLD